jgi:DNA polymerase
MGYGCGGEKFMNRCLELAFEISLAEANSQVKDFRNKEKEIVALWKEMDNDFKNAFRANAREYSYQLPSGRMMTYRNLQVVKNRVRNEHTDELEWRVEYTARTEAYGPQKKLYGGLLVENLVQATSRDVFAEKLLELDDAGFNWIFHIHDEVIIELSKKDSNKKRAEQLKNQVMTIIKKELDWLEGCPLDSEAGVLAYYSK